MVKYRSETKWGWYKLLKKNKAKQSDSCHNFLERSKTMVIMPKHENFKGKKSNWVSLERWIIEAKQTKLVKKISKFKVLKG